MIIKILTLKEISSYGTWSADFFCHVDDEILKKYSDISEEQAKDELEKIHGNDKELIGFFDRIAEKTIRHPAGRGKILLAVIRQAEKNIGHTVEEIKNKYKEYKKLKEEIDNLI